MLQELKDRISIRNIRQNLLLILSSFAFMGLNLQRDPQKIIAMPVACLFIVLFYSQISGITERIKVFPKASRFMRQFRPQESAFTQHRVLSAGRRTP